ncbi:MAG TPA: hypothetical protein PKH10_09760, partial [bacterium]|nr:hypothetical protein [bacterium]
MRISFFLLLLCFAAVMTAQEANKGESTPVTPEPAVVETPAAPPAEISTEAPTDATVPAPEEVPTEAPVEVSPVPTVEDRVKALEERQARLVEENGKLRQEIEAKKKDAAEKEKVDIRKNRRPIEFRPYGFIELIGWAHDTLFNASEIPLYAKDDGKSTTGMTAKRSRLGTKVFFPRLEGIDLTGMLEIDFFANMADTGFSESYPMIRMRHAFFDLGKTWDDSTLGFKAGQTWAVAAPNVFPALINPGVGWGVGNLWQRMPLADIYFTQKFAKTFSFTVDAAVARAMTGASANRNGFLEVNIDAGDASHIPQVQGQLSLKGAFSGLDLLVAVGGAWGRESYKGG